MTTCQAYHNSGRATLYQRPDGWAGCVKSGAHWGTVGQGEQADVIRWLELMTGQQHQEWDVVAAPRVDSVLGGEVQQLRLPL